MAQTNRPMIRIHDSLTNEVIDREMNEAEFAQYQIEQSERQSRIDDQAAKALAKAALLDRLGLTEDEAKLLLG